MNSAVTSENTTATAAGSAAEGGAGAMDGAAAAAAPTSRRRTVKRVKRVLGFGTLALAVTAAGGYFWLDATSEVKNLGRSDCTAVTPVLTATPAGVPTAADHRAVCDTLRALTEAWGRGDATAYGEQFTADATYTTYVGTHYQGRQDIAEGHRALFGGFVKGTKLADSFLDVRFHGPDTAIVTSRGDTYSGAGAPKATDLTKTQTYTLVREADRGWRIAAFHNTKRQSVMERLSFLWDPATRPAAEK
ncbi:SgcJ/EcaC family oxidoreductase [Streptomyces sp. NPDC089799]|uniref:SgcJ/EcaC family oxidoreductase n=1 Tax=Streptomyces sp. NPDC089799 TaxID=3155066 RepID=UPI003420832C